MLTFFKWVIWELANCIMGRPVMTGMHNGDDRRGYSLDRPNPDIPPEVPPPDPEPGPPPEIPPPDPTDIDEGDDKRG